MTEENAAATMFKVKGLETLAAVKKLDLPFLLKGLGIYILILLTAYSYIKFYGSAYILKQEEALPSVVVNITKESPPPPTQTEKTESAENKNTNEPLFLEDLLEQTNVGKIPTIRKSDNLTSFRAYQAPFDIEKLGTKKVVAFAVLDYGLSEKNSNKMLEILPSEVSLVLSPYAKNINSWVAKAQTKGHEIWLNLPIQNKSAKDQGAKTLFHHVPYGKKRISTYELMSQTSGYVGIAAFTDETASYAEQDYLELTHEIYSRGLGFLELNADAPNIFASKALVFGAPYLKADGKAYKAVGEQSFDTLEKQVLSVKENAITVVPAYPQTIKSLGQWIEKIGAIEYAIAPVSAIYDLPLHQNSN